MIDISVYTDTWSHIEDDAATPFEFPGGEQHLKVNYVDDSPKFDNRIWYGVSRGGSPADLVQLGLVANVAFHRGDYVVASLPYFPAARSDRGEPTGGGVYADIVNAFEFDRVVVLDPHSRFTTEVVDNVVVADVLPLIWRAIGRRKFDAVIAPDAGAADRAMRMADHLGIDMYQGEKHRDFETGRITGLKLEVPKSGSYLVVDDICDGGGTFRGLAAEAGVDRDHLSLWVTHGIFSGKAADLKQDYGFIATTDSHPGSHNPNVASKIVPCATLMYETARKGFPV